MSPVILFSTLEYLRMYIWIYKVMGIKPIIQVQSFLIQSTCSGSLNSLQNYTPLLRKKFYHQTSTFNNFPTCLYTNERICFNRFSKLFSSFQTFNSLSLSLSPQQNEDNNEEILLFLKLQGKISSTLQPTLMRFPFEQFSIYKRFFVLLFNRVWVKIHRIIIYLCSSV